MKIGIIVNYNNYQQTILCVKNLEENDMDLVIVVDNCSENVSYEMLRTSFKDSKNVFVIRTSFNNGYACGNNFGLRYVEEKIGLSKYNIIYIVNPDVAVNSKSVNDIQHFIENNDSAGIVSSLMNGTTDNAWRHMTAFESFIFNSWVLKWILFHFHLREGGHYKIIQKDQKVDVIGGAFFGIRQDVFKKVHYFDEGTFLYYEEEALFARMKKKGYQNYLLTDSIYEHIGRGSTSLPKVEFKKINDQSRNYVLKKFYGVSSTYLAITKLIELFDNFLLKVLKR